MLEVDVFRMQIFLRLNLSNTFDMDFISFSNILN